MATLSSNITSIVACISGNTGYVSEIHRAENIVRLFPKVPAELHLELINSVLLYYALNHRSVSAEEVRKERRGCALDISSVIFSKWGERVRRRMIEDLEKVNSSEDMVCTEKMADIIYSLMSENSDFICSVIIFVHLFYFLNSK